MFEVVYNEQFFYNPNLRSLKRKVKGEEESSKPILLIYYKYMFMDYFEQFFKQVLVSNNYDQIFDIYYSDDEEFTRRLLETHKFEDGVPMAYIIDPS